MSETKPVTMRDPFPAHQIGKLPKPTTKDGQSGYCDVCKGYHRLPAVHLDYIGHAAITDRLLDVDPNWNWEPLAVVDGLPVMDNLGGMWIKLTVNGVTRLGYGDAAGKSGANAIKEVIGDAIRNAAMRFGAGLELWHKGDLHLDPEPEDKGELVGYDIFETNHLQSLRDASLNGLPALQAAFKSLPVGEYKAEFWKRHEKALKTAAKGATK